MSLKDKKISDTYPDVLQLDNSGGGVTTSLLVVTDGTGGQTSLSISDDVTLVRPVNDDTTGAFLIRALDSTTLFVADTTNTALKGIGAQHLNTQYAYFGIQAGGSANYAANTHQAIPFMTSAHSHLTYPPTFGTGTDPATTFTTAEANTTRASDIVVCMWHVPDDIIIDSVKSIIGADTATGDTLRMHLMSYTFTSGSTSCLGQGALLAHQTTDAINAGSEQAYSNAWTLDSSRVASGKVILAFLRSDSVNSDYSVSVVVKYHIV